MNKVEDNKKYSQKLMEELSLYLRMLSPYGRLGVALCTGKNFSEEEVRSNAREVLSVLSYRLANKEKFTNPILKIDFLDSFARCFLKYYHSENNLTGKTIDYNEVASKVNAFSEKVKNLSYKNEGELEKILLFAKKLDDLEECFILRGF